jgi:hypothetical protein
MRNCERMRIPKEVGLREELGEERDSVFWGAPQRITSSEPSPLDI